MKIRKDSALNERIAEPGYAPKKTGIAYKVFKVKNGKLYPPMVANPGGEDTPVGVWLKADVGEFAGLSKTGRPQVKSTQSSTLAFRPGWHLGDVPRAPQFDRRNKETGEMEFPKDFVWAECEYAMDVDYQKDSDEQGHIRYDKEGNPYRSDKYQHSLAGLPRVPEDGYYKYRTNPRPDTVPWVINGAIKVNRLLGDDEVNSILQSKGIEPIHRQGGDKTVAELGLNESLEEDNMNKDKKTNSTVGRSMADIGIIEESTINEDVYKTIADVANEIDRNTPKGIWADLVDYKPTIFNCFIIIFEIDGDWKHDHMAFDDYVEEFFANNEKYALWKIDKEEIGESLSDYYKAYHKIFVCPKEKTDELNNMAKMFR